MNWYLMQQYDAWRTQLRECLCGSVTAEYVYAHWWRCRGCGEWVKRW